MITHIVRESSSGDIYAMSVPSTSKVDEVYRQFARDVMKMPGTDAPNFDTGNVDIDVYECPLYLGTDKVVFPGDEE